jgi:acylphosphatase
MHRVRAHLFIAGRVQGVGFRYATQDVAFVSGVTGWVRNRQDGQVEAVFEGDRAQVESMIQWCREGPPAAKVTQVKVEYEEPQGLEGFEIRRTA